jgi:hypothetical protein
MYTLDIYGSLIIRNITSWVVVLQAGLLTCPLGAASELIIGEVNNEIVLCTLHPHASHHVSADRKRQRPPAQFGAKIMSAFAKPTL